MITTTTGNMSQHWYLLQATSIEVYLIQINIEQWLRPNPTENCEMNLSTAFFKKQPEKPLWIKKEAESPTRLLSTSPSDIIIYLKKTRRPQASAPLFHGRNNEMPVCMCILSVYKCCSLGMRSLPPGPPYSLCHHLLSFSRPSPKPIMTTPLFRTLIDEKKYRDFVVHHGCDPCALLSTSVARPWFSVMISRPRTRPLFNLA